MNYIEAWCIQQDIPREPANKRGKRGLYEKELAGVCTRCQAAPRRSGQRWCATCFAAYQRAWRAARAKAIQEAGLFKRPAA